MNNTDKIIEILKENCIVDRPTTYDKLAKQINSLYQQEVSAEEVVERFIKEELPDSDIPFHFQAEGAATLRSFAKWMKAINLTPTTSIESEVIDDIIQKVKHKKSMEDRERQVLLDLLNDATQGKPITISIESEQGKEGSEINYYCKKCKALTENQCKCSIGYQRVKASDRLPEKNGDYFVEHIKTGKRKTLRFENDKFYGNKFYSMTTYEYKEYYWLEIISPDQSKSNNK